MWVQTCDWLILNIPGKLGINYTLAWSKMFREVIDNVSAVMCGVLEEITPGE